LTDVHAPDKARYHRSSDRWRDRAPFGKLTKMPSLNGLRARARAIAFLLVLTSGCGAATRRDANEYQLTIDLRPSITALGSDDLFVSDPAATLLVALGPSALPPLDRALGSEPAVVRLGVVDVVKQIGGAESVPVLLHAADDPDEEVRASAILALGSLGDRSRTGPTVEKALEDPSQAVRRAAVVACSNLCESRVAIERLVALTLAERSAFAMSDGREGLRRILAGTDRARAAEAERAIAAAAPADLAADDINQRGRAALLLADAGDRRALPALSEAAEHATDPLLQAQAIAALERIGDESSVALLGRMRHGEDPRFRLRACQALATLAARGVAGAERERRGCDATPIDAKARR
jgi:HEAT repeat protein